LRGTRRLAAIALCLWAAAALAQPAPGQHRVAFINLGPAAPNATNVAAFRAGMAELGYVEGRNLTLDIRWGDNKVERLPALARELLAAKPRVVVSTGGPPTARAVQDATSTVPVVFVTGDPVAEGLVANFARPGRNLTGIAVLHGDLDPKRLELLKRLVPRARRLAVMWNPAQPSADAIVARAEAAAKQIGFVPQLWKVRDRAELEAAFAGIAAAKPEALYVIADPVIGFERARIVEFSTAQRLPAVYFWREFAELGGLASYGTNLNAVYRRLATLVDKVLKGANPGELPIEQPALYELVVNLRTAKALDLAIPTDVLSRADQLIE
jgi:putative ABC transport system substrate-binding protein